jgi:hypothetical protein
MVTTDIPPAPLATAIRAAQLVCIEAGDTGLLGQLRRPALAAAVQARETPQLVDGLMRAFSFRGISDSIAANYLESHGNASYLKIVDDVARPRCTKLRSYWHHEGCGYHKGTHTCAEPELIDDCPLPRIELRNGRLNQTAYALALFVRDVTDSDLVGWIDDQLGDAVVGDAGTRPRRLAQSLVNPMRGIHGISDKVLNMALSDLLLAAGDGRPLWLEAGGAMIAIDSLVHNWLHRTGILQAANCAHPYGNACHGDGGCRDLVEHLASHIDASTFNGSYPRNFPRFVQKAIWSFCAQSGLARCNGITIDDRVPCDQHDCPVWSKCAKVPLKSQQNQKA